MEKAQPKKPNSETTGLGWLIFFWVHSPFFSTSGDIMEKKSKGIKRKGGQFGRPGASHCLNLPLTGLSLLLHITFITVPLFFVSVLCSKTIMQGSTSANQQNASVYQLPTTRTDFLAISNGIGGSKIPLENNERATFRESKLENRRNAQHFKNPSNFVNHPDLDSVAWGSLSFLERTTWSQRLRVYWEKSLFS